MIAGAGGADLRSKLGGPAILDARQRASVTMGRHETHLSARPRATLPLSFIRLLAGVADGRRGLDAPLARVSETEKEGRLRRMPEPPIAQPKLRLSAAKSIWR